MKKVKTESLENKLSEVRPRVLFLVVFCVLLGLTLAMFGDVLFAGKETVFSQIGTDLSLLFVYWRDFGFSQLRQGNLSLWNPHNFSGTPFFGGFQSALLYPPNWLYLILPLTMAINFGIVLHVFLAGLFMYLWTTNRGLHPAACLLSSVLLMFSGAHFMHIYAGHLPHLSTMVWTPLLFLAIDGMFKKGSLIWCLLGIFAITMQILAGFPQYVFYTAVAVVIYSGLCIIKAKAWLKIALGLAGMYVGASLLAAVQLLTGLQAVGESVRSSGLSYEFAAMFSFPPENLLTLIAPGFLGNMTGFTYWGRGYLWEMSLFISLTGFILAIYGCVCGNRQLRRFSVTMMIILLVLALGAHTPLFKVLYTWIPGFDKFRGNSKFIFHASIFLTMLSGIGFDSLIKTSNSNRLMAIIMLISGLLTGALGLWIYNSAVSGVPSLWGEIMSVVASTKESYIPLSTYKEDSFVKNAGFFAAKSMFFCGGTFLLLSLLFFLVKFSQKVKYLIALLAILEIFVFARTTRATFNLTLTRPPEMLRFSTEHPGDYRVLHLQNPNSAMSTGMRDIWGYDPLVLRRYAQFMTFTQGQNPDEATMYLRLSRFNRLYSMLRVRYMLVLEGDRLRIHEIPDVMPRVQLIQDWVVIPDRDQIFAAMDSPDFDPRQKVILEKVPDPAPIKSDEKGIATVVSSSTDYLIVEADLPQPAILLITDAYSSGWRAVVMPGGVQQRYDILPANYTLRAIPLTSGTHRLRIEYLPVAFHIGKWVSIASIIIYTCLLGWCLRKDRR